jgi:hypothetical protein
MFSARPPFFAHQPAEPEVRGVAQAFRGIPCKGMARPSAMYHAGSFSRRVPHRSVSSDIRLHGSFVLHALSDGTLIRKDVEPETVHSIGNEAALVASFSRRLCRIQSSPVGIRLPHGLAASVPRLLTTHPQHRFSRWVNRTGQHVFAASVGPPRVCIP